MTRGMCSLPFLIDCVYLRLGPAAASIFVGGAKRNDTFILLNISDEQCNNECEKK
jgi:hypothetical protein